MKICLFLLAKIIFVLAMGFELRASCLLAGALPLEPLHQPAKILWITMS
jgi:hypothetical protein